MKFWSAALMTLSLVVFLLMVALSYVIGVVAFTAVSDHLVLVNYGSRTTGVVIEKHTYSTADDTPYYEITYAFSLPSGELLTDKYDVPIWRGVKVGDQIEIAFDTEDPTRSMPVESGFPVWIEILTALFGIASILFCAGWFLVWAGRKFAGAWGIGRRKKAPSGEAL